MRYIRTKDGKLFDLEKIKRKIIEDSNRFYKDFIFDEIKANKVLKTLNLDFTAVGKQNCTDIEQRGKRCHFGVSLNCQDYRFKSADTIDKLCDCFVKIKQKGNCKPYILKFDFKDLPLLKQQRIKYPTSPVYGAIHIEDKGLIYVAKMNEKGELELL